MKRKAITGLLVFTLLSSSLFGCAGKTDAQEGATATPVPTATLAPTATSAPAATTAPADTTVPTATPEPTATPVPSFPDATYTTTYPVAAGTYCEAERLTGRAFIAVTDDAGVLLSWRSYEDTSTVFQLEKNGQALTSGTFTNYLDADGTSGDQYTLTYTENGTVYTETAIAWEHAYQEFTLIAPEPQKLPNNHMSNHTANDMSVGDLNGDGDLELIVKWYPEDAQDNSKDGWTGTTILDAYDIDIQSGAATLLWRIDLGLNIRSGAHYVQYQVWDYDGDGIAEVMCKTADGTTTYNSSLEETGHVGAASMSQLDTSLTKRKQDHDYRSTSDGIGRVLSGPEYLTVFSGATGEIIDTVEYIPSRGPENSKGVADMNSWGDNYGNRVDRFLAGTAYIDEGTPAAIFARGYYARTAITAWKLVDKKLILAWSFDAPSGSAYAGQGPHCLSINDVDNDGFDEIIYGALCLDHNGSVLYCTGLGHGDAMHVSDWNGDGKLEVFQVHEDAAAKYHIELHDAETGEIIWGVFTGKDTGRGMAADIDPRYPGAEMWAAANDNTFDCNGNAIYAQRPSINFSLFWDGDLLMELFDYNNQNSYTPQVQKWNYLKEKTDILLTATGTTTSNGTKGNAGLIADLYGDWREELVVRCSADRSKIRIYSTSIPTEYSIPCLLTDRAYREGIAWQNTAYNQPANLTNLISKDVTE